MSWLSVLQLILRLLQQAGPIIQVVTSMQGAINAAPGTPEHTAAVTDLTTAASTPAAH